MKNYTKTAVTLFIILMGGFSLSAQTKPRVKDDPINRVIYETKRLVDPVTGRIPEDIRQRELAFARGLPHGDLKSLNATGWINRGPFNVGGRTRALAIDVNDENIILAGGVSGGMWRSTDGGSSWTMVTAPDQLHSATAIAQDTRAGHTDTWYYVTGELSGNSATATGAYYQGDGVFKSTDNGITWTLLESTSSNTPQTFDKFFDYCWNVKVSPVTGSVFVATYGAIKRSQDGGVTWETMFNTDNGTDDNYVYAQSTDIDISSTGTVYAAFSTEGDIYGFYRSDSDGDKSSWIEITPDAMPASYNRTVISIAPSNENIVYFLTHVDGEDAAGHNLWKYMYDSANDSYGWEDLSGNIPDESGSTGSFDSQGGYDLLVKVKPDDDNFVIIGGTDLWRSTDGFRSKSNYTKIGGYGPSNDLSTYTNHHADQHSLVFYPGNTKKVISGHDGGLSLTDDITKTNANAAEESVVWSTLNVGYLTTQAYAVAIDMATNGDGGIIAGFQDNGTYRITSTDAQRDWNDLNGGDGGFCALVDAGNTYYSSSQNGTVYRDWYDSAYDTWRWTQVDPDGATGQDFINPFLLDPNNSKMMYYTAGDVIWRNSDLTEIPAYQQKPATKNWVEMTNTRVLDNQITALDVSYNPANILYYGTDQGRVFKVENANTGDPVNAEITSTDFPTANIGCVKVNLFNSDEVLISFTNYKVVSIWRTVDGGSTWESISGNLEENADGSGNGPSVRWVDMLHKSDGTNLYFAATSTGLYSASALNGDNTQWTQEGPDLIGNVVVDMVKARKDGTVVIGTHGNGIYGAKFDVTSYIRKNRIDNVNARIYPDPSDGIFTIEVQNSVPASYRVIIFNMSGQAVYYSEQKNIMNLHLNVDLTDQPKGVYNIQVMKGSDAFTYKMLLK